MKTDKLLADALARRAEPLEGMFAGSILAAEYGRAAFTAATGPTAADEPDSTKAKTCKPTRNPCCREDDDGVEGTKEKTCKPTRNPCCQEDDGVEGTKEKTCKPTRNPCCREDDGVEGTKEKTCRPTRNPCCHGDAEPQSAGVRLASLDLLLV